MSNQAPYCLRTQHLSAKGSLSGELIAASGRVLSTFDGLQSSGNFLPRISEESGMRNNCACGFQSVKGNSRATQPPEAAEVEVLHGASTPGKKGPSSDASAPGAAGWSTLECTWTLTLNAKPDFLTFPEIL